MSVAGLPNPRGEAGRAWVLALFILSSLVFAARVFTRLFIVKAPGWDDAAATIAWVLNLGLTISSCLEVRFGMGLHMNQISTAEITALMKAFWVSILIYNMTLYFTKVAIIAQYLRFFTGVTFRKITITVLVFTTLASLWAVLGSIFLCLPVESFWNSTVKPVYCMPHAVAWYFNAALNVVNDIVIIILPMPVLKGLNMPFRQRVALMTVFALGSFVCLISFVRIKQLHDVSHSQDIAYTNVSASTWSAIECSVGIICASLPALKATATRYFPRLLNSIHASGRRPSRSGQAEPSHFKMWARNKGFSSRSSERTKISATKSTEGEGPYSELRELNESGRDLAALPQVPPQSRIGVTTVMNQRIEHLDLQDRGHPSSTNLLEGGDIRSESRLFFATNVEKAQGDKSHDFISRRQ